MVESETVRRFSKANNTRRGCGGFGGNGNETRSEERETMKVSHTFRGHATCPVDPRIVDDYEVTVETNRLIKVEDIFGAFRRIKEDGPIFQEDLTQKLATALNATVTTK